MKRGDGTISVVCVHNDDRVLNEWLIKSLETQNTQYEFHSVTNDDNTFKSAAVALNYIGNQAGGKYILFAHQDIDLLSPTFLKDAEMMLDGLPDLGIAGIIGMSENGKDHEARLRNMVLEHVRPVVPWGTLLVAPEKVQTVDECLFFIPRKIFETLHFDEKTCDGWHFYAVDYCLSVKSSGLQAYVLPLKIHHRSEGFSIKFSSGLKSLAYLWNFFMSLKKLVRKHKPNYRWIYTTNGDFRTDKNLYFQGIKRLTSEFITMIRQII